MSERRPHWDSELEQAVSAILFDCYENGISEEQVYQVIAAVEDWHEKFVMHGAFRVLAERAASAEADRDRLANQLLNEVPDSYIQMKARALTAEAAIARVRELHREHVCDWASAPFACFIVHGGECAHRGKCRICHAEKCDTIRALDGAE